MKITMEQVIIHIPEGLLGLTQVVRCRECRYYHPENRGKETWVCDHPDGLIEPQDADFCSHGRRKEKEDDA